MSTSDAITPQWSPPLDLARLPQSSLLRALLDHFPNGSVNVFDRGLRYLLAAGQGLAAIGLSPDHLVGKTLDELYPPDAVAYVIPFYRRALAGEALSFDLAFRDHLYWLQVVPLTQRDGSIPAILVVAEDTTARHAAEQERQRLLAQERAARTAAQQAVRVRDEMLALLAHDMQQPLQVLRGRLQLLQRRLATVTPLDVERFERDLTQLDDTVRCMAAEITALLDVAQLQAGQTLPLDRQPVDLVALVRSCVAAQQRREGQRITVRTAKPAFVVVGDRVRLGRVMRNLLSNAIKYSPLGRTITVTVGLEESPNGSVARMAVQDRGIGIPATDLPHIFAPFHRGQNADAASRGLGLGLASVRQIVEQHGGTIIVTSQVGEGTTMTIRLPRAETTEMPVATE